MNMKVADYLLQTLEKNGVSQIFGNPGTTELPLVKACEQRPHLRYVVALSEVSAVPMADGYARANRTLGVVNLHVAPGLGNGMGTLYTAATAGTPMLVIIGGQDRRFLHTNPILWGPVEKMADCVCKGVFSLSSRFDAAANIRRALRLALSPPYAPVALICPPDLLESTIQELPSSVTPLSLGGLSLEEARRYAKFLTTYRNPAFIAAEDLHWAKASVAMTQLAERLGAPIYAAPYTGVLPVSSQSTRYAGYLPPNLKQIEQRLASHDALFFIGGRGLRNTLYSEAKLPQAKIWIGHDSRAFATDGEYEIATVCDIREALITITAQVRKKKAGHPSPTRTPMALPTQSPKALHPTRAVEALLRQFKQALWVDESGLSTSDVRQWMQLKAGDYLINGSGGIGWGLAASVGAALGQPKRQIVALIGDGSALYASEALWSAEHHGTHILLIILSNRRYATLNEAASRLAGGALKSFTIEPPVIDFSGLARLYDWDYESASTTSELTKILKKIGSELRSNTLLELKLDPELKPVTAARHF